MVVTMTTKIVDIITNTASLLSMQETDPNPLNNSSTVSFDPNKILKADVSVIKTVNTTTLGQGYVYLYNCIQECRTQ